MTKEFNSSWQSKAELFITAQQKQFFNPPSGTAEIEFYQEHTFQTKVTKSEL